MSTQRVDEILKQAEPLSNDEKIFLAKRLMELVQPNTPNNSDVQELNYRELRCRQHTKWLKEHQAEYAGRYVALDGEKLIADGSTYREVSDAARQAGIQNPFITHVPDPNIEYFAGW